MVICGCQGEFHQAIHTSEAAYPPVSGFSIDGVVSIPYLFGRFSLPGDRLVRIGKS